ncbi:MAG TPA: hypothetical protein VJG66_02655 [Patescibacteria group bacterium]|nr:hypothetical protein [Patescibacteria group bacterium]
MIRSISQSYWNIIYSKNQGSIVVWLLIGVLAIFISGSTVLVLNQIYPQASKMNATSTIDSPIPVASQEEIQPRETIATSPAKLEVKSQEGVCEEAGGLWTEGPLSGEKFCNEKMADAGKECSDYSECQSSMCYSKQPDGPGQCGEFRVNYGCYYRYYKGKIAPVQLCGD